MSRLLLGALGIGAPDAFVSVGGGAVIGLTTSSNRAVARLGGTYYWTGSVKGQSASAWGLEPGLGVEFRRDERTWRVLASGNKYLGFSATDSLAASDFFFRKFPVQAEVGVTFR